jgi:hypothetical protein
MNSCNCEYPEHSSQPRTTCKHGDCICMHGREELCQGLETYTRRGRVYILSEDSLQIREAGFVLNNR